MSTGEILQCRELWSKSLWGCHPEISGSVFFKDVFRLLFRPDLLLRVFYSLLVNSINHKYNFHNYILSCSGIGMEDQRVSGVFKSNAEPHHRFGSADRISALCVLRDRGEVSGTNSREHLRYQDIRPLPETYEAITSSVV